MLTKEMAAQIQSYWNQSQDPNTSTVQQFEAMLRAGLLLARATINIVDAAQNHWDNSGSGAAILAATDGEAAGNGQYDVEYIKEIQMMYLSYKAWLTTDVEATFMGNPVAVDKTPRELIMQAPAVPAS